MRFLKDIDGKKNVLTPQQKLVLDAMEYDRWYDATLDGLPGNGRTFQALIKKGLVEAKRVSNLRIGVYEPMRWTHRFRKIKADKDEN